MGCGYCDFGGNIRVEPNISEEDLKYFTDIIYGCEIRDNKLYLSGEKWKLEDLKEEFKQIIFIFNEKNYKLNGAIFCEADTFSFDPIGIVIQNNKLSFVCMALIRNYGREDDYDMVLDFEYSEKDLIKTVLRKVSKKDSDL
jgi:hypothetical protein